MDVHVYTLNLIWIKYRLNRDALNLSFFLKKKKNPAKQPPQ
jgi:hypothetical protein